MSDLTKFLQDKIIDCEEVFENANTDTNFLFMQGMLQHGGETNALLMNIGKRQAYIEVSDYLRKRINYYKQKCGNYGDDVNDS